MGSLDRPTAPVFIAPSHASNDIAPFGIPPVEVAMVERPAVMDRASVDAW
jgi:hypothetical protein